MKCGSMLPEALETIKAWGFTYKTVAFCWAKTTKEGKAAAGMGYWTRSGAELCLLATKGKPKRVSKAVRQVVLAQRGEHSAKPPEVRDRIVQLMGDVPRIELFARDRCLGWHSWGNEVESDIELEVAA